MGLDETSGARSGRKLQRLNKAKRYRVARNPIHGYVVNPGTYIAYHVVHDFGGWTSIGRQRFSQRITATLLTEFDLNFRTWIQGLVKGFKVRERKGNTK